MIAEGYISDLTDENLIISYELNERAGSGIIHKEKTDRQKIKIVKSIEYNEMLFLDGRLQSTKEDEYIYHEALVQSLFMCCGKPRRVLVLGGSEGCILREILQWESVEEIVQVDWDYKLVKIFKENLRSWNDGAYDNPKVKVYYEDALSYLKNDLTLYDAIIVDLIDPEPSNIELFKEIIELSLLRINEYGGLIANVGSVNPLYRTCADDLAKWCKTVFNKRYALKIHVPSYMQPWCFLMSLPINWRVNIYECDLKEIRTRFFDKKAFSQMTYWSKDYSSDLRDFALDS
jgi:spermidine synthase